MNGKKVYISISVLGILLALTLGAALAQEPREREGPQGTYAVDAIVSSKFSYQGLLNVNGTPVTGTQDMVFHLFSDDACTTPVGGDISLPGVQVNEGYFNVELTVSHADFDGGGLWLEIQIEGVTVSCQEILPVPYALSLRPGASIQGVQESWDILHAVNTAEIGHSYAVYAQSLAPEGRGVYGYASGDSGLAYGVYGRSNSLSGAGVYARGVDAGADIILGGNSSTTNGDDGRIYSDPVYASSDIVLITNDTIRVDLDDDGDGEDADFEIRDKDDTLIFNVDESGAITFGGAGIAAFPRPAYDSGWVSLSTGGSANQTHNLGGNVDNYVLDLTCMRSGGAGVNNWGVGGDANVTEYYGAWWSNLTTTAVTIHRWDDDTDCPNVRIRIWVYP